jgi:hypothetical protein
VLTICHSYKATSLHLAPTRHTFSDTLPGVAGHRNEREVRLDAQALSQHAVIRFEQLLELGFQAREVQKRRGLYRRYRGVYSIVPPPMLSFKGRSLAAVFACGPAAALSHRSAADLHGLRTTNRARIDVIVPGRTARRHHGIDLHDQLDRNPHHPGSPTLKAVLEQHSAGTTVTWSELEELSTRRVGRLRTTAGPTSASSEWAGARSG